MKNNFNLRQMINRYSWLLFSIAVLAGCNQSPSDKEVPKKTSELRSMVIQQSNYTDYNQYNGVVEAVHQADLAAQVAGTITVLNVTEGNKVKKNQSLLRIDAQTANQVANASSAQLASADAQLNLAQQELDRQKQLYAKDYISKGALDHAEAAFKSAKAQVDAQAAQKGVANSQTNFHVIKAPYDAIVSSVPVTVGDMAMPGKILLTLYDASQLRVSVVIPQSVAMEIKTQLPDSTVVKVDGQMEIKPTSIQLLPAADATTHTRVVRLSLPANLPNITPGLNVSVRFPIKQQMEDTNSHIYVPISALVKHAEMTGVYVITQTGQPLLRQLRTGITQGDQVEVLSGLSIGEKIALEPQVAASVE
jgi:membrane fusion protein, multidrug efflux system